MFFIASRNERKKHYIERFIQISCYDRSSYWVCGRSEELIGAMTKIHQYSMLCAPITAQMGAIEALKNGNGEWIK